MQASSLQLLKLENYYDDHSSLAHIKLSAQLKTIDTDGDGLTTQNHFDFLKIYRGSESAPSPFFKWHRKLYVIMLSYFMASYKNGSSLLS